MSNTLSQVRMEFKYVCTAELIRDCHATLPPTEFGTSYVCETKRFARCNPGDLG
jgi:hypothetical protein